MATCPTTPDRSRCRIGRGSLHSCKSLRSHQARHGLVLDHAAPKDLVLAARPLWPVPAKRAVSLVACLLVVTGLMLGLPAGEAAADIEPLGGPATFPCDSFVPYDCPATSNAIDAFYTTDTATGRRLLYAVTQGIGGVHPDQFKFVIFDADTMTPLYVTGTVPPDQANIPGAFSGVKKPERLAYNPNTNQVYLTRSWTSEVAILTGMIAGAPPQFDSIVFLNFSASPVYLAVNPKTNRVYVPRPGNYGSYFYDDVVVIDASTRSIVGTIPLKKDGEAPGVLPSGVAVDPETNKIYVARSKHGDIAVLDGTQSKVEKYISIGGGPIGEIALDSYTKKLYVTHPCAAPSCDPVGSSNPDGDPYPRENSVSVVDVRSGNYMYSIRAGVGINPGRVAINTANHRVYVSCFTSNEVTVIDGRSDAVVQAGVPRKYPTGIAIDRSTSDLWVVSTGFTIPFEPLRSELSSINRWRDIVPVGPASQPRHFFAEGTTRSGFQEWLTLFSPDVEQEIETTYILGPGQGGPIVRTYRVGPRSRATINVNAEVGPEKDVSIVTASRQKKVFFAERVMYYNNVVISSSDGSVSPGFSNFWAGGRSSRTEYFFAEGTTRAGFREWLTLFSPSVDQTVQATFMFGPGQGPPEVRNFFLPRNVRVTIDVNAVVGPDKDVSARLVSLSNDAFYAERPMYYDSTAVGGILTSGGHNGLGLPPDPITDVVFPEGTSRTGFRTFYTLVSPVNQTVTALFMPAAGQGPIVSQDIALPAQTRVTLELESFVGPEKDVAVRFRSLDNQPFYAERPMYFVNVANGASGATLGVGQWVFNDFRVQRRTDYYLAEGTNRQVIEGFSVTGGVQGYLLLASPEATNTVTVEIDSSTGEFMQQMLEVPKARRVTLDLNLAVGLSLGSDVDYSIRVTSKLGESVFVERAMYFKNFQNTRGAHLSQGTYN